jgi:hypothetical protein
MAIVFAVVALLLLVGVVVFGEAMAVDTKLTTTTTKSHWPPDPITSCSCIDCVVPPRRLDTTAESNLHSWVATRVVAMRRHSVILIVIKPQAIFGRWLPHWLLIVVVTRTTIRLVGLIRSVCRIIIGFFSRRVSLDAR